MSAHEHDGAALLAWAQIDEERCQLDGKERALEAEKASGPDEQREWELNVSLNTIRERKRELDEREQQNPAARPHVVTRADVEETMARNFQRDRRAARAQDSRLPSARRAGPRLAIRRGTSRARRCRPSARRRSGATRGSDPPGDTGEGESDGRQA